ncbi:hypothetical protein D3C85_1563690 [compost metagenome]
MAGPYRPGQAGADLAPAQTLAIERGNLLAAVDRRLAKRVFDRGVIGVHLHDRLDIPGIDQLDVTGHQALDFLRSR